MRTALVADDSTEVRALISLALEQWGFLVTSVGTGREALQRLPGQYFDLIVTDIVMPDADGVEVLVAVRKQYPTTRVVAMSGDAGRLDPKLCLRLATLMGAHLTLEKPFTISQLQVAVRQLAPEVFVETA